MAKNKQLEQYKKTNEFQNILTKFKNRIEILESRINAIYNSNINDKLDFTTSSIEDLKHKLTNNEFDVKDLWVKFLDEIISDIKDEKWEELSIYYKTRKDNANKFLFLPIANWQSNSILRYTETDMLRWERSQYYWLEFDLDNLIWQDDIKQEVNKWAFK